MRRYGRLGGVPEPVDVHGPALARPRMLRQRWTDVAFLHWALPPAAVAPLLPPGVEPDVLDGRTYAGLVAFRMTGTAPARGPALPWLGTFLETNVRLYSVDATGRRGVVFLSLDANRLAAVLAGNALFGLPYRWARMELSAQGDDRVYTARVRWRGLRARSRLRIRAGGPAPDGPLERFLTARWGLHVRHLGRTWYVPNLHLPWSLRRAEVLELDGGLVASVGLSDLAGRPPDHVLFSDGVDAEFGFPGLASTPRR